MPGETRLHAWQNAFRKLVQTSVRYTLHLGGTVGAHSRHVIEFSSHDVKPRYEVLWFNFAGLFLQMLDNYCCVVRKHELKIHC